MRTFNPFRRKRPDVKYTEVVPPGADTSSPVACDGEAPIMEALLTGSPEAELHDAMRDGNGVLGLIGTAMAAQAFAPWQDGAAMDAATTAGSPVPTRDLVHSLYEQYCGALEDPQASLASDWHAHVAMAHRPSAYVPVDLQKGADGTDSIDALLSGARVFDDVFCLLGSGDRPDPAAMEPVPEVLRLFAPAEYHAATARRPGNLPPALSRREHQTPAVDSPLPASGSTLNRDTP